MANFEIPKGYVHVPRFYSDDRNQAAELLAAADEVGVDQATAVVSTSDGYHVKKKVAAKWSELYEPEAEDAPDEADDLGNTEVDEETGLLKVGNSSLAGAEIIGGAPDSPDGGIEGASSDVPPASDTQVTALGVTAENSNSEIDDYAANQVPPVDLSSAKNRVEKIALLEAARGFISGDPTVVAAAFALGIGLPIVFALWSRGGLRRAEAAG